MKKFLLFLFLTSLCWMPTNAEAVRLGDADLDGTVTISDVTTLIDYLLTGHWADEADWVNRGDSDLDGTVSISDVTNLIDYLLTGHWTGAPITQTFTVGEVSFKMIAVEGGTFWMGGTYSTFEKPIHQVSLSSYAIGETEVTQALWEAVMGELPTEITEVNKNPQYPIVFVNWNAVQEFITKLNEMTGMTFRLPTEAEWEYTARGGNKSLGFAYSGSNIIDEVGWYSENSGDHLHQVATLQPNELGIYDMTGNAAEWCNDRFGYYYYSESPSINPQGPDTPYDRSIRGVYGYSSNESNNRWTARTGNGPQGSRHYVGFRLAL